MIGFAAYQCFVKYHLEAFTKLGVEPSAEYLVNELHYPPEYLEFTQGELNFPLNYGVLDKHNGLLLKLGANK